MPRSSFISVVVVMIAAILAYGQVVKFELGSFDEDSMIVSKVKLLRDSSSIADVVQQDPFFRKPGLNFYRPIQNVSLLFDAKIGKGKPSAFHFTNLILHVLTCIFVLLALQLATNNKLLSLLLATMFAVNPLFSQAIAWVPGRGDLIVGFCGAAMLYVMLRDTKLQSLKNTVLVSVLVAIAIFAKESSIVIPVAVVAFYLIHGDRNTWKQRNLFVVTGSFIISGAVYLWARSIVVQKTTPGNQFGLEPLLHNIRVMPEIIAKFFVPFGLQPMATYELMPTVVGVVLCLALILWIPIVRRNNPDTTLPALLGIGWYLLFMVPAAMFIHADGVAAYDYLEHRAYIPMIGLLYSIGVLASKQIVSTRWTLPTIVMAAVCLVYLATTLVYVRNFATPLAFYNRAIVSNPNSSLAYTNRGIILERNGDLTGAMRDYTSAVEANSTYAQAYVNRGNRYGAAGELEKAKSDYLTAIRCKPSLFPARYNLANYYMNKRLLDSAYEQYSIAAELMPTFAQTYVQLGVASSMLGDNQRAEYHLNEAVRLDPLNAQTLLIRGKIRFALKNLGGARSDWQQSSNLGNREATSLLQQYPSQQGLFTPVSK